MTRRPTTSRPGRTWPLWVAAAAVWVAKPAAAQEAGWGVGSIRLRSDRSVAETLDRLESLAKEKGLKVFARIDHAGGAATVGVELPPTQLLIFGSPRVGAPLMRCDREVGLDLPMKALAWKDAEGGVWLTVTDPAALTRNHDLDDCADVLARARAGVLALARAAAAVDSGRP
ncbi:MAG: DUF302 domain-containing protein [Gemmatimonadota bacterium]